MYTIIIQSCWLDSFSTSIEAVFSTKTEQQTNDAAVEWILANPPKKYDYYKVVMYSMDKPASAGKQRIFVMNAEKFHKRSTVVGRTPHGEVVEL